MYQQRALINGFTLKRFVTQTAIILLLGGIISASIVILDWDMELLFIACQIVGYTLFTTVSVIHSRLTQFWVMIVADGLVGLIPFIILVGYCYFHIENTACSVRSVKGNSIAFWVFPSIIMWILWILAPLGKTRRRYG